MKYFLSLVLLTFALTACTSKNVQDRSKKNVADIQANINDQRYVFLATTAQTTSGRTFQLTSGYSLAVTKDTVTAYLPYYGVAYTAPMDPSKGGINFTSVHFEYNKSDSKKNGWVINIKPKDTDDAEQMFLNLSADGYGTLQVTGRNRQSISFSGHIEKYR